MFKRLLNKNFRKPKGLIGRYIIRFMKKNQTEYDELYPLLKLNKDDKVLEIGFGLGKAIYDYSHRYDSTFYGIDFSRLMYSKSVRLNHEKIKTGNVILICADFDTYSFDNVLFNCIYLLNVIYFWDDIYSRLKKMFSLLNQNGKVIIFMVDIEIFRGTEQPDNGKLFYLRSTGEVIQEMEKVGFKSIETIEHTQERNCYYIVGYKE